MFQALVQRAQNAAEAAATKILSRAAAAVPFLIAAGFGTAALTVKLTELYGSATSYMIMGGLFALIGGVAMAIVQSNTTAAEEVAPAEESPSVAEAAAPLLDRDVLLAALTTAGPVALPAVLRLAARNLPLLVMAILVGILFFGRSFASTEETADTASAESEAPAA